METGLLNFAFSAIKNRIIVLIRKDFHSVEEHKLKRVKANHIVGE